MSASIEKSLYVGITNTRFSLYDNVRLKLLSDEVIEGTIEGFIGNSIVQLETEDGWKEVNVGDIEDCIN